MLYGPTNLVRHWAQANEFIRLIQKCQVSVAQEENGGARDASPPEELDFSRKVRDIFVSKQGCMRGKI